MDDWNEDVECAKVAEAAERYEDMAKFMKKRAEQGEELSLKERNLLSVAYKNVVGTKRSAWRITKSIETKMAAQDETKSMLAREYLVKIEEDLKHSCKEVLVKPS